MVLECRLRVVGENTTIDSHCGTIIIFHSINAASKCYRFQSSRSDYQYHLSTYVLIKISIFKQAGIATLVINGNICNRHSTVIQESVIGIAILNTIFLATVVGATVQSNRTLVINSSFLMGYIINRTLTVNRQGCTLFNSNGMTGLVRQLLAIQVKRNGLASRNNNIFNCVFQQS